MRHGAPEGSSGSARAPPAPAQPWVCLGGAGGAAVPRPPRSAAQKEGAASAARCPAWELPSQEAPRLPRSPPGKGPCAALPAAAFPRLLPAPRGAWRSLGRGRGCWLAERLAWGLAVPPEPQPGSAGLERIARPGQEPEGCVCLVLEGEGWQVLVWSRCSPPGDAFGVPGLCCTCRSWRRS